jgi:predicted Zn-dependent protease with MMP-like domain
MSAFETQVRRALDSLPPDLAAKLENVAVVVEDENTEDPELFGLFEQPEFLPARISVYRRPLQEREIRITVLHELAHYFGIDEERLDELGYG